MATIKSALVLQDKMSKVMRGVTRAIDAMITGLESAEMAGGKAFDPKLVWQMRVDVGEVNARLSEMERDYQKAAAGQQKLNNQMQQGVGVADGLLGKVKGLVAGYASMRTVKALVDLSDQTAQNYARVNLMNDGLQETSQLIDSIRAAANRSRGSFQDMTDVVAKLGNNARGAFKNSAEIVDFAELLQKQFKITGTDATAASNAMLQLTQALGSGVLRGDELNSVMENAPMLSELIAKQMDVNNVGQIRNLAAEGKITADIVKGAVIGASKEINEQFEKIPMTWQDVWTRIKNDGTTALEPLLGMINRLANNPAVLKMINGITSALGHVAVAAGWVIEKIGGIYSFFVDNWSIIAPIIGGVALAYGVLHGAVAAYNIVQSISNGIQLLSAARSAVKTTTTLAEAAATKTASGAQIGLNAALLASPVTWVVLCVIALIAALVAVCAHIAKTSKVAKSTIGVISGALVAFGAFLLNIVIGVLNSIIQLAWTIFVEPFLGIIEWVLNACNGGFNSFGGAVANLIGQIISWFLSLGKVVTKIIDAIFGTNWSSGLSDLQSKVLSWGKNDNSITVERDAPTIGRINYGDAYKTGAEWGDGVSKKVKEKLDKLKEKFSFNMETAGNADGYNEKVLNSIADDTGSIAKSLDTTNEELSWIRDVAERDVINRFTTAEIKIDMTGMTNEIKNDVDVDGLFNRFTNDVRIALQTAAAGVH